MKITKIHPLDAKGFKQIVPYKELEDLIQRLHSLLRKGIPVKAYKVGRHFDEIDRRLYSLFPLEQDYLVGDNGFIYRIDESRLKPFYEIEKEIKAHRQIFIDVISCIYPTLIPLKPGETLTALGSITAGPSKAYADVTECRIYPDETLSMLDNGLVRSLTGLVQSMIYDFGFMASDMSPDCLKNMVLAQMRHIETTGIIFPRMSYLDSNNDYHAFSGDWYKDGWIRETSEDLIDDMFNIYISSIDVPNHYDSYLTKVEVTSSLKEDFIERHFDKYWNNPIFLNGASVKYAFDVLEVDIDESNIADKIKPGAVSLKQRAFDF